MSKKINGFQLNIKLITIIALIIIVSVIFFSFSFKYNSDKLNPVIQKKIYGFHSDEIYNNEFIYSWMSEKNSLIRIRPVSEKITIPVFCFKSDIEAKPINLKIYIDDTLFFNDDIKRKDIIRLEINLAELGYKINKNNIIDIHLEISELWSPGGADKRLLGVAVGEILFHD